MIKFDFDDRPGWEDRLREKLESEVPEGTYNIGAGKMKIYTGKKGYIDYHVALRREIINWYKPKGK